MSTDKFLNKKVLVMGLGLLGGGVATTKWLAKHGAHVAVTDLRNRKELASSIQALGDAAKKVRMVLGKHRENDFRTHDFVVVNPAVPRESKFLKIAWRARKEVTNDARIFFDLAPNPIVAITGTRGKTTTTNWIAHFLRSRDRMAFAAGNTPERPLLADLDRLARRPETPAVLELSSWQLELVAAARRAPDIAVITNLYPDHLNRYRTMEDYARAKAVIFQNQNPAQAIILNADNMWTKFFLKINPKGKRYFFSLKLLPRESQGLFLSGGSLVFAEGGVRETVAGEKLVRGFTATWGAHNLENLLAAMLGAHLFGMSWRAIITRIRTLPRVPCRQEIVIKRKSFLAVNDSASTSPDATIAALRRFPGAFTYLITGGTDKKLEFRTLAREVKRAIPPPRVFFLNGSATKKLIGELTRVGYFRSAPPQIFESLPDILRAIKFQLKAQSSKLKTVILFSPGAASFEKFKNEFDRGAQFTRAAQRLF